MLRFLVIWAALPAHAASGLMAPLTAASERLSSRNDPTIASFGLRAMHHECSLHAMWDECPEGWRRDNSPPDLSRRYFAEAMIGSSAPLLLLPAVVLGGAVTAPPKPALAAYGEGAGMELPNYIDFLIEKNRSADPDLILYRGGDPETQLRRIAEATDRLGDVRSLAQGRKWSQVQGIITGPLGTLVQTMNAVVSGSGGSARARDAASRVKGDVIAIGQAATKKSSEGCIAAANAAAKDLEAFVKIAFQ